MRVTLESTTKIVELRIGDALVPARVWQGVTDRGVQIHGYIVRIGVGLDQDMGEFERDLERQADPRADVAALPARLVI